MLKIQSFFQSAVIRLTMWYLLILAILSLLFSFIVYNIAANELHRPIRPNGGSEFIQLQITPDDIVNQFERYREQRFDVSRKNLLINLTMFNIFVVSSGGFISYLLAKRTLEPIQEALESQIRFSSDVSHELRTPLTVMQSEIEIGLRASAPTVSTHKKLLESNLDEVHRLRALTDRLLILANEKILPLNPTKLDDIATEAVNRIIPLAQSKKIEVESTVGKQTVLANFDTLADAVVILLDNAIKYSPVKSKVKISAETQGKHALLHISDNGHGIAAKDLPHIFDRFYRADTSRSKQNVEGHGLGLSIAKRIIESHQGKITVISTKGKGTTFTIKLLAG